MADRAARGEAAEEDHPDVRRLTAREPSMAADRIGRFFDPLVLTAALLLAVGVAGAANPWVGAGWAALAGVGCAVVPEAVVRLSVRCGRAGDRQLVRREQRHVPMLVAAVSVLAIAVVLTLTGAPPLLVATVWTVLAGVAVLAAVTRVWKASIHAGVAATVATVATGVFGIGTLAFTGPICLAVAWARVRAGRHSLAQVLAGSALGAVVTLAVFPALR